MSGRQVARFNKRVTNRIQGAWAPYLPPWLVVVHRGRTSGRTYRTPVLAAIRSAHVVVNLHHGEGSDWVCNLLAAGEGVVIRRGRTRRIRDIRVIDGSARGSLPAGTRWITRFARRSLVAHID